MARETIDFGIDLGTTNSAIAMSQGADADVLRNNLQREYTPSAVYVNRSGKVYVGDRARDRVESDPENACAEFKLQMGVRGEHKAFTAAGRSMTPEDLSAEVLKSLRGDVQRSTGEAIDASVITVPAAFELDQCDATRRAATLAGLQFAPLLQEPTAAAWAYSVRGAPSRAFWLVYDFGGGTFDAAVVKVQDGEFTVINHAGDNFLGGKLIDWALVDEILIPAAQREHGLTGLARDNRYAAGNIAKLKIAAENAKIELSQAAAVDVDVALDDGSGGQVDFSHELTRADVERLSRPLVARSVALCRKALAERGAGAADIERVLLVGGTTLSPILREMLADPAEGLGIPLDRSLDPVTVVARGAAIFASTQRLPRATAGWQTLAPGQVALDLSYQAVGQDTDPLVGGKVTNGDERDWTNATIEFANPDARPPWRSGQVPLNAEGAFATRLLVEENTTSSFSIELRDSHGTLLETVPAALGYRHAPLVGGAPVLSHSVGVGLADNEVQWLLEKGTELPASKRVVLRSTVDVRRSAHSGLIRVPIVQGERPRADRNTLIGRLDVRPDEVKRDVPADSEIEVFIEIDTSFTPRADAYVPILDEEFEIRVDLARSAAPDLAQLKREGVQLAERFDELRQQAAAIDASEAARLLDRFEQERVQAEIDRLLTTAEVDPDAAPTCEARLRDAQSALDDVEEALRLPQLIDDAQAARQGIGELVRQHGTERDQTDLREAEARLDEAVAARDRTLVRRQTELIQGIGVRVLQTSGQLDAVIFGIREERLSGDPNGDVQQLLAEGRSALAAGDTARLGSVNARLDRLVPDDDATAEAMDAVSTVRAGDRR